MPRYISPMGLAEEWSSLSPFEFGSRLRDLIDRARDGDGEAHALLESLVRACDYASWASHAQYCCAVTSALIQTGTHRSMLLMMRTLNSLPPTVPFGAVELFASNLPVYGENILPTLRGMTESPSDAVRAVAIQTLCNLFLEGKLTEPDAQLLRARIEKLEPDRFGTDQFADLVKSEMQRKKEDGQVFLASILVDGAT